jgi:hypothetical protein
MITIQDWQEFLYECGLTGQQWLHVNHVGTAYICWRLGMTTAPHGPEQFQRMMDSFRANPEAAEDILETLLAEPQYCAGGVIATIPEGSGHRIKQMLHLILNEKPNPREWRN